MLVFRVGTNNDDDDDGHIQAQIIKAKIFRLCFFKDNRRRKAPPNEDSSEDFVLAFCVVRL